jgi:hypothetical protein
MRSDLDVDAGFDNGVALRRPPANSAMLALRSVGLVRCGARIQLLSLVARYCAYWNGGLAFKLSFVAPGRTNFFSTSLNLETGTATLGICANA